MAIKQRQHSFYHNGIRYQVDINERRLNLSDAEDTVFIPMEIWPTIVQAVQDAIGRQPDVSPGGVCAVAGCEWPAFASVCGAHIANGPPLKPPTEHKPRR